MEHPARMRFLHNEQKGDYADFGDCFAPRAEKVRHDRAHQFRRNTKKGRNNAPTLDTTPRYETFSVSQCHPHRWQECPSALHKDERSRAPEASERVPSYRQRLARENRGPEAPCVHHVD